jgi:hypothetical protein
MMKKMLIQRVPMTLMMTKDVNYYEGNYMKRYNDVFYWRF